MFATMNQLRTQPKCMHKDHAYRVYYKLKAALALLALPVLLLGQGLGHRTVNPLIHYTPC
jgi:hypothetical protein